MKNFLENLKQKDQKLRDAPWVAVLSFIECVAILVLFYVFHIDKVDFLAAYFQMFYILFSSKEAVTIFLILFFTCSLYNIVWAYLTGGRIRRINTIIPLIFIVGIYYYFAHLPDPVVIENGHEKVLCDEVKAVNVNEEQCKQCSNRKFENGLCLLPNK